MANTTFQLRRSSVAGKAPTLSTLSTGELALNITDRKLYSSDGSNIFEVAANLSSLYIGNSVSYIAANSTNIVANDGLTIEQTDASAYLTLKVNGHETKFNPSGGFEASGAMYGGSYGSNLLDVSQTGILNIEGGLYGVQIKSSPDRVNYKTWTFGTEGRLTLPGGIYANGSNGSAGQVLTSSGSGNVYWSTVTGGGSLDVDAQYTWTNTQTFSNTITFSSVINGTSNSANYIGSLPAANVVSNAQLSGNLAYYTNTANLPAVIGNNTANDVYYVGGVTAVNVVSNAQLTANLANYTNTSSFYLDTLQDVSAGGPTSGQVLTWNSGLGQWTPEAVPSVISNTTPGYYGSFYDANANQSIASTTTAYLVRIANTFEQSGISVVNNTQITFGYTGTYELIYSIQLENTGNQQEEVNFWLRKNNSDVAFSDSKFTVSGRTGGVGSGNPGKLIATTPFVATANSGDYYEIVWKGGSTSISIVSYAAGASPTTPVIPGVIVTAKQIANIIPVPPGTNAQLLFNDSNLSNGTIGVTYNKTTNNLFVSNSLFVTSTVNAATLSVDGQFVANSTFVYANNGVRFTPKAGSTTISTEGSVFYDSLNHALNYYTDGATPHEIGLQTKVRVYNPTGSTITKGTAVYINGANSNRPTIAKAISNSTETLAKAIGIVFDDILTVSEGFVLTSGVLQGIDTRDYTAGQEIYISAATAGALSNTDPSYPNYTAPIGYALNSALDGQIFVTFDIPSVNLPNTSIYISNGTGPIISNNFTFDYANNVLQVGNSTTNATIGYFDTSGTTTFMKLSANTNASLDSVIVNYSTDTNASSDFAAYDSNGPSSSNFIDMGINSNTWDQTFWTINGPSDGYVYTGNSKLSIGTAGSFPINFFTGGTLAANERMRITPTGNVGIGNTTPVNKLSVGGDVYLGGNVTITGNLIVTGTTVTVNTTNLDVLDKNITIAKGAANGIDADGAGITVDTIDVGWYYNNTSNTWQSNVGITPSSNLSFDLGTTGLKWSNVYANNIVAANLYGTLLTSSQPYITANNANNLGGEAASSYQLNSTLSANVAKLTANAAGYLNGKTEANLNVNNALTANNSDYLGGTAASGYQTTAGLATAVSTLNANNAGYLGGVIAGAYLSNTGDYIISGVHRHIANLSVNGAFFASGSNGEVGQVLTSNGSSNVYWSSIITTIPDSYVQNTDSRVLSGNLEFTGTNVYFTTAAYIGAVTVANLTGVYTTQTINAAVLSVGSSFIANTSQITIGNGIELSSNGGVGLAGQVLTSNGSTGSPYWSTITTGAAVVRQQYTASGSQTVFTVTTGYAANNLDVYLNGVKLQNGVEVDVSSGTTFTILSGTPVSGTIIEVVGTVDGASVIVADVNTATQYVWSNTQTFNNTVTISSSLIANGSSGTSGWVLTSNGSTGSPYWSAISSGSTSSYRVVSSDDSINASTDNLILSNSSLPITISLPTLSSSDGYTYTVKNINTGAVTVAASGSELIDGYSNLVIQYLNSSVGFLSTSTGWIRV